jgi:hypothetical protein
MTWGSLQGSCLAAWPEINNFMDFFYLLVKLMAVAAAVFVGWLCTGWVVRTLVRLAFHKQTPRWVETLSRVAGAIVLGVIVWMTPLGPGGGGGWFGSGGSAGGDGGSANKEGGKDKDKGGRQGSKDKKDGGSPSPKDSKVVIHLLPSKEVKDNRDYRIEGESKARNLAEVKEYLKAHQPQVPRKGWVEIIRSGDTVPAGVGVHKTLVDMVKEHYDKEPVQTTR